MGSMAEVRSCVLALAALLFLLSGCARGDAGKDAAERGGAGGFELRVLNYTQNRIYPILRSGGFEEDFGVVAPRGGASVDFTPFKMGEVIRVAWGEKRINPKKSTTIETKQYKGVKMRALWVIYSGEGKWSLKAFDKNNKEIKPKPTNPPKE